MTIIGIDPGTATTGFGIIEIGATQKLAIIDYGVITTDKTLSDSQRLLQLSADLAVLIKKHQPERLGIEKLYFKTNQKTAITVAQARGVIMLVAEKANIPIFEYTPLQVKNRICGYGKADKQQVQFMVKQTFNLKTVPKPDDAADALAIAVCVAYESIS